jgi:hypothetical protein
MITRMTGVCASRGAIVTLTPSAKDMRFVYVEIIADGICTYSHKAVRFAAIPLVLRHEKLAMSGMTWRVDNSVTQQQIKSGHVYFIEALGTGLVKIGFTRSLSSRLNSLRTSCPVPIRLLWSVPGDVIDEKRFHERFASLRKRGEWFELTGVLAEMTNDLSKVGA